MVINISLSMRNDKLLKENENIQIKVFDLKYSKIFKSLSAFFFVI